VRDLIRTLEEAIERAPGSGWAARTFRERMNPLL
jgi:hypothetical protein